MLSDLAWLPAPAPDFRERVRALRAEAATPADDFIDRATALAATALDESQLGQLARLGRDLIAAGAVPAAYSRLKLGLIGDDGRIREWDLDATSLGRGSKGHASGS